MFVPVRINGVRLTRGRGFRALGAVVALVAGLAAAAIAWAAGRNIGDIAFAGVLAAAILLWLASALRALAIHRDTLARRDAASLARHANQDQFNRIVWDRLVQERRVTAILLCERALGPIEARLAATALPLDSTIDPAVHLAEWREVAGDWVEAVVTVVPDIAEDIVPADAAALRHARTLLPPSRNLSSADLRAATAYIVERRQLDMARRRYATQRDTVLDGYRPR